MVGKGDLIVTGQLGDVMRESAMAALSYIRTRALELNIDPNFQETTDLHIHLPENAIPKDGPSAGITIATALVSALTKRPVRNDLAMTGEVTLLGSVLAIGGLKEKVLAAQQANITNLIIPAQNKKDLADIPAKIRQRMHFTPVDTMDQVIDVALLPAPEPSQEEEQKDLEPFPLRLEERLPVYHEQNARRDQNMRRTSMSVEQHSESEEDEASTLMIPPSEHTLYPHVHAVQDEADDK
ncbi:S16 family serine protease [Ktedonosporobacter rubrisoli]|uniref:S16 family serine protease n=1 Tax=Ktedonosporobacter rubrisoli TaxID=2509675 RepID=UPI001A91969F|nr:S16 family serine protease [Ktedonosporobacter rubrisoli]